LAVAKGREVMLAEQGLRGAMHCLGVERHRHVPDPPLLQRRARPPVENAVFVMAPQGGESRLEFGAGRDALQHCNWVWLQMVVERFRYPVGVPLAPEIEMHDLPERVDARIGASGRLRHHRLARKPLDRFLEHLLHGGPIRLPLPAGEGRSIVFERQAVARHGALYGFSSKNSCCFRAMSATAAPARRESSERHGVVMATHHGYVSALDFSLTGTFCG